MRWRSSATLALLSIVACSEGSAPPGEITTDSRCTAGEEATDGGTCRAAGVPPEACAAGFVSDAVGGCNVVGPDAPCASGQLALPGETVCHEVAPCTGRWGRAPVDATSQYVDGVYAGGASDGTSTRPWTKIQDAISASAPGAVIAIAAGSYVENVVLQGKAVRLWGSCPAAVEIVSTSGTQLGAAVRIEVGASGTELHDMAVRGDAPGVILSGATGVVVDHLWIHDMAERAVDAEDYYGPTDVTVRDSLVERVSAHGLLMAGATLVLERSVVRDTQANAAGEGRGVTIQASPKGRGACTVRETILEHNHWDGLYVSASDATIESTVVRDTQPGVTDQRGGRAMEIRDDIGGRAKATIVGSIMERNRQCALVIAGSDVTIENTVIRDTAPRASDDLFGRGLTAQSNPTSGERSVLSVHASVIERSFETGISILGSDATIDGTIVRDTGPATTSMSFGDGIAVSVRLESLSANMTLTASRIENSARAGVSSFGGTVGIGTTVNECNAIPLDGEVGDGVPSFFTDLGGNVCGCAGDATACRVSTTMLSPPEPL